MDVPLEGLNVIKSLPWLNSWIMNKDTKPERIQDFIFSISKNLGNEGQEFVKHLLTKGGIIWNALLQPGNIRITHYFNMLSSRKSLGTSGMIMSKKLLRNPSVIAELLSKGVSKTSIEMLNNFYNSGIKECYQARLYLRNIFR